MGEAAEKNADRRSVEDRQWRITSGIIALVSLFMSLSHTDSWINTFLQQHVCTLQGCLQLLDHCLPTLFSCPRLSHEEKRIQTPEQTTASSNRRRDIVEMLDASFSISHAQESLKDEENINNACYEL